MFCKRAYIFVYKNSSNVFSVKVTISEISILRQEIPVDFWYHLHKSCKLTKYYASHLSDGTTRYCPNLTLGQDGLLRKQRYLRNDRFQYENKYNFLQRILQSKKCLCIIFIKKTDVFEKILKKKNMTLYPLKIDANFQYFNGSTLILFYQR